jgi:hypothetical protein
MADSGPGTGTFDQPDFEADTGTAYKTAIDNSIDAMSVVGAGFAVNETVSGSPAPDMTVQVRAGTILNIATGARATVAAQTTAAMVAPAANPRRDIVYIDQLTGAVAIVTGTEAASPADPAIPAGKIPLARIRLAVATTAIDDTLIDDLRPNVLSGFLKQGYRAVNRRAPSWKPQTTNGCAALAWHESATYRKMTPYLAFAAEGGSPADQQYAQTMIDLPPSADASAMIYGTLKWFEDTGGSPNEVVWQIEVQGQGDGDALDSPWSAAVTCTDAGGTGIYRQAAFAVVLPAGSPVDIDTLVFRLTRLFADAADNLAGPANFVGLQVLIYLDSANDA